jgi:hypothetical protein
VTTLLRCRLTRNCHWKAREVAPCELHLMMRSMRSTNLIVISLLAVVIGCFDPWGDDRELIDEPMIVGPVAHVLTPGPSLRAPGPFNEICLAVSGEFRLDDHTWKVRAPDGTLVTPSVTFVAPDGSRESFPQGAFLFGDGQWTCFETRPPRDLGRRYIRVELSADHPLRVLRVRWTAGKRFASL